MALRLFLTRHGRSAWHAEGRFQRCTDTPSGDAGREQARRLADRLQGTPPGPPYASRLGSAQEIADMIGQTLVLPMMADEHLEEHDGSHVTGLTCEEIEGVHAVRPCISFVLDTCRLGEET